MIRRLVVVAVGAVLLTGCSATTAPKPGLSADDVDMYRTTMVDSYWSSTGLGDELRPTNPAITVVPDEEWGSAYVTCMNQAGHDQYLLEVSGGYSMSDESWENRSDAEIIDDYLCITSIEIEGQFEGLYNQQQLDYLFDYYQQMLVPCLEVLGYDVATFSTRDEFTDNGGGWHPYFSIQESQQDAIFTDTRVPELCPPTPVGIDDPGYAGIWAN